MAKPVIMPRLGQSVESCIIAHWIKTKGDKVSKGDILLSYETDKASFDLEAEDDGILLEIFYNEGDEAPVLGNIAVIGNIGEPVEEFRPQFNSDDKQKVVETVEQETREDSSVQLVTEHRPPDTIFISPRAKILADRLGVYSNNIKGSGPDGRIIEMDIKAAAQSSARLTPTAAEILKNF